METWKRADRCRLRIFSTDRYNLPGTGIYTRAISAINVAAIYSLLMYGSTGNGNFCGIDLKTEEIRS
ncbi:hypothetical protein [Anditalea andensis]|uniref:Uncharacterized protein n=1 Tax=Anditalea andensis TaxID=1048983 RepID=A0A074LHZ5_9BACT|nr:hypothetical protein [Anditalea andensis]KEO73422.1 hypothetical protein EL17_13870 [Anditalea andensis]